MKLKEFNKTNSSHFQSGKPTVRTHKSGMFNFSGTASEMIGLNYGDHVKIHQDEDSPKDWYLQKTTEEDGFIIRGKTSNDSKYKSLIFSSQSVRISILKSIDIPTSENITCLIGQKVMHQGLELWPIITKMAENEYKKNGPKC